MTTPTQQPDPQRHRHATMRRQFLALLQEQGRALSPEEIAVLDAFLRSQRHLTAEDILREARRAAPAVTAESAAEILLLLCEYKIAHEVTLGGQVLYEHYHLHAHHDHFVCVKCGAVRNFSDPRIERLQGENARQAGFRPLLHQLEIYGVCAECVRKESEIHRLEECPLGETARVTHITGNPQVRRRLTDLGILPGTVLRVLGRQGADQALIVAVKGTRLVLSFDLCRRVRVSAIDTTREAPGDEAFPPSVRPAAAPPASDDDVDAIPGHHRFWFGWRWRTRSDKEGDGHGDA